MLMTNQVDVRLQRITTLFIIAFLIAFQEPGQNQFQFKGTYLYIYRSMEMQHSDIILEFSDLIIYIF